MKLIFTGTRSSSIVLFFFEIRITMNAAEKAVEKLDTFLSGPGPIQDGVNWVELR